MSQNTAITAEAIAFVEKVSYNDLPAEALRIGKRCMVDTLGVMIAGCSEHSVHILVDDALEQGGRQDALLLSGGAHKAPAAIAARTPSTGDPVISAAPKPQTAPTAIMPSTPRLSTPERSTSTGTMLVAVVPMPSWP